MRKYLSLIPFLFALVVSPLFSAILSQEGAGYLESKNGQMVLHLKGSPYERGFQHGKLLQAQIQANISNFIDAPRPGFNERKEAFIAALPLLLSHVPSSFQEEMRGLADGSGLPLHKIVTLNLFPEMFHCFGVTVAGDAAAGGSLYHLRVLEYAIGKNLQETAVLMIVEPDGKIPYLNVSYAGFIGSVTGMNAQKISVGEIGGLGYGKWDGMPMAFLIREILEKASTLEEAKKILADAKRTCEYYYILGDGKDNSSVAAYATPTEIQFIEPGATYALLAQKAGKDKEDKLALSPCSVQSSKYQVALFDEKKNLAALILHQPKECLLLTGFTMPERYPLLAERVMENYGHIGPNELIEMIKQPIGKHSDLHNAIFQPAELKVWIAHAGPNGEPAWSQPYVSFCLEELLQ